MGSDFSSKLAAVRQVTNTRNLPLPVAVERYIAEATRNSKEAEIVTMRLIESALERGEPFPLRLADSVVAEIVRGAMPRDQDEI